MYTHVIHLNLASLSLLLNSPDCTLYPVTFFQLTGVAPHPIYPGYPALYYLKLPSLSNSLLYLRSQTLSTGLLHAVLVSMWQYFLTKQLEVFVCMLLGLMAINS